MTYQEAMQAEAEMRAAVNAPAKQRRQRGETKAQLAHRARLFGTPAKARSGR